MGEGDGLTDNRELSVTGLLISVIRFEYIFPQNSLNSNHIMFLFIQNCKQNFYYS